VFRKSENDPEGRIGGDEPSKRPCFLSHRSDLLLIWDLNRNFIRTCGDKSVLDRLEKIRWQSGFQQRLNFRTLLSSRIRIAGKPPVSWVIATLRIL